MRIEPVGLDAKQQLISANLRLVAQRLLSAMLVACRSDLNPGR